MKKERRQLQLRKFKVATLTAYFLKGGTENENSNTGTEPDTTTTTSGLNSNVETTCTILAPQTKKGNPCETEGEISAGC